MSAPWGAMDPNSHHQLWSRWTFTVIESGKRPSFADVKANANRWVRRLFGSAGHMRVAEGVRTWIIEVEVEGVPAHDPDYVLLVRERFQRTFVEKGWGSLASGKVGLKILAGDMQSGRPREQLIVMPRVQLS